MNQNFVKNVLENNMRGEGREMIDWRIYDSLLMTASATQNLTFFQNTLGSVGRARTNMKAAGQLPSPQTMTVFEIGMAFKQTDGASMFFAGGAAPTIYNINTLFAQLYFDVKIEPSIAYEGEGLEFHTPVDYVNDTGTTLGVAVLPNNMVGAKTLKLKVPLVLPANRSFSVNVTLTTPAAARGFSTSTTLLYVWMKGLLRRNS